LIDLGRFTEWYDDLPLDNVPVHDCMVFSCTAGLASSDTGLAANAGLTYVVASCKGTIENRVMGKIISVNTNQLRCLVQVRGMMTLPLFVTATAGDRGGLVIAATAADDSDWGMVKALALPSTVVTITNVIATFFWNRGIVMNANTVTGTDPGLDCLFF
jgi:hypothetical protein